MERSGKKFNLLQRHYKLFLSVNHVYIPVVIKAFSQQKCAMGLVLKSEKR